MSAGSELQGAAVRALSALPELTGTYDGPPARAPFPYAVVDAGTEQDWSHKSGVGREVLVALTLWDDQPTRLQRLADAADAALGSLGPVTDWQLVSFRFVKRRLVRDVSGPWAAALDYRARLLSNEQGE
ncbi:tail completion protein gp17 [Sphingomonas arenae]|uniref:tail completion protein gp17 n=1 Tax=Sphingomonas arenae TaxID=2812555 RepID=UPI00196823F5|nr:DUF3168 domain-containing protein [Sphingomonas arenae]